MARGLDAYARLLRRRRADSVVLAALDAVRVGDRHRAVGYIGLRLWERFRFAGFVATGVLGTVNIPYYEEMARRIHWWEYSGCRMISNTPYYIIVGEFAIAMLLGFLAVRLRRGSWVAALLAGIGGGVAIFICYVLAYAVTDKLW